MNYIYDVLLNFNKNYYECYEWNKDDEIYQIRKIPIIKINKKTINDFKNNTIKFDLENLKFLYNKTERFKQSNIVKIKYASIFTDGESVVALKLNKDGLNTFKSSLLFEEAEDVIHILKFQKEINLKYKILDKRSDNPFKTRFEAENEKFIINELNKIYNVKDYSKMNYLCLECFGKLESNFDKAYNKLKKEINNNDNFHKIYDIFKIANQK